jgi:ribosomal protein S18 acetylase RimI-like enzyme
VKKTMITFKKSVLQDIKLLLKFGMDFYGMNRYKFDEKKIKESLENLIMNEDIGRIWIIEYERQPAGYIILTFGYSIEYKGRDAFIDELFIDEAFRGKGLGKKTMDFVVGEAVKLGINAIHLEVEKENDSAKNLYLKFKFRDNGRTLMTRWIEEEQ